MFRVNIDELLSTDSLPAPVKRGDAPKKEVSPKIPKSGPKRRSGSKKKKTETFSSSRKPHQHLPHPSRGRLGLPTRLQSDPTSLARALNPVSDTKNVNIWVAKISLESSKSKLKSKHIASNK